MRNCLSLSCVAKYSADPLSQNGSPTCACCCTFSASRPARTSCFRHCLRRCFASEVWQLPRRDVGWPKCAVVAAHRHREVAPTAFRMLSIIVGTCALHAGCDSLDAMGIERCSCFCTSVCTVALVACVAAALPCIRFCDMLYTAHNK